MTIQIKDASGVTRNRMTLDDLLYFTDPAGELVTETTTLRGYFSDDFGGAALDATKWDVFDGGLGALDGTGSNKVNGGAQAAIGSGTTGITHSVGASALAVAMGTVNGAEKWLLSKTMFCGTEDILLVMQVSQKLAANSIQLGLVEVDPSSGYPILNPNLANDFTNKVLLEIAQTTSTTNCGLRTVADSSPAETNVAGVLTANMVTAAQETLMQVRAEDVHVQSGTIDSAAAKNGNTLRVSSQVPNDTKVYKLLLRLRNVAAPASSTTFTLYRVLVQDHQAQNVSITEAPGGTTGSQGMAVNIAAGSNLIGATTGQVGYTDTSTPLGASATFTGSDRATTSLTMFSKYGAMAAADKAGTLCIDLSLDAGNTWIEVASVALANGAGGYHADLEVKLRGAAGTSVRYRSRFVNGATAQTAFALVSSFSI